MHKNAKPRNTMLFSKPVLRYSFLMLYSVSDLSLTCRDILLLEGGFLTILVAPFNVVFWKKCVCTCMYSVRVLCMYVRICVRFVVYACMKLSCMDATSHVTHCQFCTKHCSFLLSNFAHTYLRHWVTTLCHLGLWKCNKYKIATQSHSEFLGSVFHRQ